MFPLPIGTDAGSKPVTLGAGYLTAPYSFLESPPPGAGVETATSKKAPPTIKSSLRRVVVIRLPSLYVVGLGEPFHSPTESVTNFSPYIIKVAASLPTVR